MIDAGRTADLAYLILLLVLVGSALLVRRMPLGQTVKMLAAWALIFFGAFVVFALKDDIVTAGKRVYQEAGSGGAIAVQAGETLRIKQSEDGHFWVDGELNGERVRFLVDSGATITSISAETARRSNIEPSTGFPVLVNTANGTVPVQRGRAEQLDVGKIKRRDLAVHISETFGETNVLGMNFLSSLSGWGVEGKWLVLKP